MTTTLAPILVFAYKRKDTLQQSIEALKQCALASQSDLYLFLDGAKEAKDEEKVREVHEYMETIDGFGNIYKFISDKNKGLAASIIRGVSKVIEERGKVIVLEDDLIPAGNFLQYMNAALEAYRNEDKVFAISGYNFPFSTKRDEKFDVYFLPRPSSWGWATWRDRWGSIDWEVRDFEELSRNKKSIREFEKAGSDIYTMLKRQQNGEIDSWAVRWSYSQFKQGLLTAYPVSAKIRNIGFSGDATHSNTFNRYLSPLDSTGKSDFKFPEKVELDPFYNQQFVAFYSIKVRIWNKLKTYLYKMGIIKNKK